MKTLYVTDLDGTLLTQKDTISEFSINTINRLVGKGMYFTYATARSLSSASIVTKGLNVNIPVILYNGAAIRNALTGELLYSLAFNSDEVKHVVSLLGLYQINPLVYSFRSSDERVSWLTEKENDGIRRYLDLRKNDKRMNPLPSASSLYDGDIFYFTCIGTREELLPLYKSLKDDKSYTCTLQQELYREEYWCEIMPKKATKANAVAILKRQLYCDKIVSFGDAINDIPMFQISDESYAVENAVLETKQYVSGIIGSNEEDGVAKWLLEHFH